MPSGCAPSSTTGCPRCRRDDAQPHAGGGDPWTSNGTRVLGATVVDELTGERYRVRADATLNVTGAWVDDIVAGTSAASRRWIGGTKGTHLVVGPFDGAPKDSMYYESEDGRPMMVIPWLGMYLIGKHRQEVQPETSTRSRPTRRRSPTSCGRPTRFFPLAGLTDESILYAYTGVRPLPYVDAEPTADISRRHEIHDHAADLDGLYSVVGGEPRPSGRCRGAC